MLFSFETDLDLSELTVIANSFLFESFDDGLVSGLDGLCFVVFDHDFVQPILEYSDISHEWAFFNVPEFIGFDLFEFILESEEGIFFEFGFVFFFIQ